MSTTDATAARVLQRLTGGRWWAFLTTAVTAFITLRNGGTASDLVVAYWLEGVAWIGAAYVKDLHATGPVTCEVVLTVRSDPRAVPGQPLPDDLRRLAAKRNLKRSLILAAIAGTFAEALRYELLGGLTPDPMLWLLIVASMLSWTVMDLWAWWHSDQPSTTTSDGGGAAPIARMLLVFAIALASGLTAAATSSLIGTGVGILSFVVARGWVEPSIPAGVARRRATHGCCPPHGPLPAVSNPDCPDAVGGSTPSAGH